MSNEWTVGDKIFEIGRRRGFFWQSYEIYGGVAGFYDLGPYGVLLKNNIIELWRRHFILPHQDMIYEIETPVITPSRVFEASGHVESFTDPIVECMSCHRLFRADHLIEERTGKSVEGLSNEELTRIIRENNIRCPVCGGELGDVRSFNLLFKTQIGPYAGSTGYIRPETAQGMFVSFKRVYQVMREKLPLGIAQVGRVARNEISPRQGMLRLREFTIMEFEFFYDPEDEGWSTYIEKIAHEPLRVLIADDIVSGRREPRTINVRDAIETGVIKAPWMAYWMYLSQLFLEKIGVSLENQYFIEKLPEERAHYSKQTFDQLVRTERWGWVEVSGHAYRGEYDLSQHMRYSGEDLRVYKPYDRPRIEVRKKVVIDSALIGRTFREKAGLIIKHLKELPIDVIEEMIEKNNVVVGGERLPEGAIRIEKVEEKITGRRFVPHVVEPSFGVERLVYIALEYGFRVKDDRVIMSLPPYLAPVTLAVFPLVGDDRIVRMARKIYDILLRRGFRVIYDDKGSIGKRYARVDEIGVPYAITIDYRSIEDNTVTVRDRDTWIQERVEVSSLPDYLRKRSMVF